MDKTKEKDIRDDIKKYSAIDAVALSEGGKILISSIEKDVISVINELVFSYKKSDRDTLVSLCSCLGERLALLRAIKNSKKLKDYALEELEFIMKE